MIGRLPERPDRLGVTPGGDRRPRLAGRRPLHLALSSDEDLGCLGVGSLLELIASTVARPVTCLVGEPTLMRPADRHKGKVSVAVEVRGRTGHSSAAPRAVNAVTHAGRLIAALDEQARELSGGPGDPAFDVPHAPCNARGGPTECWPEGRLAGRCTGCPWLTRT